MFVSLTTDVVTHAFNVFPATGEDKLKDIDKVKEMKRQELSRACKVLGVQSWKLLDFPEGALARVAELQRREELEDEARVTCFPVRRS